MAVVDRLEPVDVDHQHRQRSPGRERRCDPLGKLGIEMMPVPQAGHRISQCKPADRGSVGAKAVGDRLAPEQRAYPDSDLVRVEGIGRAVGDSGVKRPAECRRVAAGHHGEDGQVGPRRRCLEVGDRPKFVPPVVERRQDEEIEVAITDGGDGAALVEQQGPARRSERRGERGVVDKVRDDPDRRDRPLDPTTAHAAG